MHTSRCPQVYPPPSCCTIPVPPVPPPIPPSVAGIAQFTQTVTQTPNNSRPPGTAFVMTDVIDNQIPLSIAQSVGAGGSVYTFQPGTYIIDYEMSIEAASSIGLYIGATVAAAVLNPVPDTYAGSTTGTTWIHGRTAKTFTTPTVVFVSPIVGTAAVVTAGTAAGFYICRFTVERKN